MKTKRWMGRGLVLAALTLSGAVVACGDDDEDVVSGDGDAGDGDAGDGDAGDGDAAEAKNIVETAVAAGSFTTLAGALTSTGLDETLAGPGPFTVFAPTDAAFAALPAGTLESLSEEELTAILTYHVVSGKVLSTDLSAGDVETVNGEDVTISLTDGVKVNDAKVTMADIVASNGVIHVIDKVLLPPN